MKTEDKIRLQLASNPIILYMKGIPANPQCGFSAKTVDFLNKTGVPYAYVNVLEAPFIREKLPSISRWPTYPQLFVNAELVGGCDIIEEMASEGSLLPLLQQAAAKGEQPADDALSAADVEKLVRQGIPDAQVFVEGAGCDLSLVVVSELFTDLPPVKEQQLILETLKASLASGKLHAVSVKAYMPNEWQAKQPSKDLGLLQIQG